MTANIGAQGSCSSTRAPAPMLGMKQKLRGPGRPGAQNIGMVSKIRAGVLDVRPKPSIERRCWGTNPTDQMSDLT